MKIKYIVLVCKMRFYAAVHLSDRVQTHLDPPFSNEEPSNNDRH